MALIIGAFIGVLGTAGVISLSKRKKASRAAMVAESKPSSWVIEPLPSIPLEEQVSLIPETPYFNPNDTVQEEETVPTNFDDFEHLDRSNKQEPVAVEEGKSDQSIHEFVDSELDEATILFAEELGVDFHTSSPVRQAEYENLNVSYPYIDDEEEGEEDGYLDYGMSSVINNDTYVGLSELSEYPSFYNPIEECKENEAGKGTFENVRTDSLVFQLDEKEHISYFEELENEMKDYSDTTADGLKLEKDALKVTAQAENPFGILGLNIPSAELKNEEVNEKTEGKKDFLQIVHSTFLEGKVEGDYDKLAHIQPVFPTLDEYERGMLNRYSQIDKEYGDVISHKIIDDEYGTQTWVCEIKGIEDTYLHVYDGTARAWLNVENFMSKPHEIGSIAMVEVCRDFTGRYEVLTFSTLEGPEQCVEASIHSIEEVSLGIEELQVKQNFVL